MSVFRSSSYFLEENRQIFPYPFKANKQARLEKPGSYFSPNKHALTARPCEWTAKNLERERERGYVSFVQPRWQGFQDNFIP